jgi:two-component system, OmpR family, response regulator CpxR
MTSSILILCVDDEHIALQVRALLLSSAGYRVVTATSGKAAYEVFLMNRVDLVIMDQMLPDMAGTDVIGKMKNARADVPIVLLTGLDEPPPSAAQADLFVTKGITPPEFLEKIGNLILFSQKARSDGEGNGR